jgi:sec-independent protein translocase protein TatB
MFDIGWSELMVIAVVAIVVIGPKDLPKAMRTVGRWSGRMRRMARDFQNQFNDALREAELDEVKKEVQSLAKIDPLADVKADLKKVETSMASDLAKADPSTAAATTAPAVAAPVPTAAMPAPAAETVPASAPEPVPATPAVVVPAAANEPAAASVEKAS